MRRGALLCGAVCLGLTGVAVLSRAEPEEDPRAERIAGLIRQLGHDDYARREAAARGLEAVGEPAIAALRAAASDPDLEVRRRAREVLAVVMPGSRTSRTLGMKMERIDPGVFLMGSPIGEAGRRPDEAQRRVRISRPFYLGAHEVTQEEYREVMKADPSWFAETGGGRHKVAGQATDRFPVDSASWYDALEFCNRLSERDGYRPYYRLARAEREGGSIRRADVEAAGGNGYRLPTEAEWEYACRAGTTTAFFTGDRTTGREGNCKALISTGGYGATTSRLDLGRTAAAGSYGPNPWGLFDMHGNVAEWCWDWYDKDVAGGPAKEDPTGPERGEHRVLRGGAWLLDDGSCRSASRYWQSPGERKFYSGFRVARTP